MTLLSGCFHYCPHLHPYSLVQTDLNQNVQAAFSSPAVSPGDIVYQQWWHFFKDPQLDRFIELSLSCHPSIELAEARIYWACDQAKIARSALLPHLFGVIDVKRQKVSRFAPGFVPGFPEVFTDVTIELATAVYELDIWRKNRSLYIAALDRMCADVANYEEAKLLLSTTIAAVYFDLQMALARKEVTKSRLLAREELLSLRQQQWRSGVESELPFYQVDTDVQLLKDLILQIEDQIATDQHALAALVGNVDCACALEGVPIVQPSAQFHQPFPLPVSLPIDLLGRRPDITAQKWLIEASCYDIKAARANFFPRIDLIGWLGTESIKLSKLFTGQTLIALGEATATLPIFLAGKLRAQLGVAQDELEIAIANYNNTVLLAVQQVSDALSDLTIASEREKVLDQSIQAAAALYQLTEQKFVNAVSDKLAVLNAFESLYIQKDLAIQVQLARYEAAVDLIRAIGGGYHECSR